MLFGAAIRSAVLTADAAFRGAVVRECGVITPELEMKWAWLESAPETYHFYDADRITAFARASGKTIHGHALLWHQSVAPWLAQALRDDADWAIVRRFITAVMPRYADVTRTWDVINEPIDIGHRADGLRETPFLAAFGPDYIRRALETARSVAPAARLFINEYDLDYDLPVQRDKRYLLLKLLERLKREGVPLDGIGLQAHLDQRAQAHFNPRILADFLNDVGALGLEIRISELDVKEIDLAAPTVIRDRHVARVIASYLDVALDNRAVGSVTCWGLSNRYSWLGDTRSLPLDRHMRRTAVHDAIAAAFARRKVNRA